MTEPASSIAGFLGLKHAALIAGAAGAVISLRYIDDLSMFGRVLAVITGTLTAGYLSPAAGQWLDVSQPTENAIAFVLGLTAMNAIPGLLKLSEKFAADPLSFIRAPHNRRRKD
ncbi:hypothetical protein [Guyparkeria halopsychrophila]|uniref:hypothetical protein n=1 Tax=Guyparkeria halopsychrophila TaxID=3139421 RepID=UPI0037CAD580